MSTTLDGRIRAEFAHTVAVYDACDHYKELHDVYGGTPEGSDARRQVGAQIADNVEVIAAHLEESRLARATAWFDPAKLRRDAVEWRSGEMYVGP